MSYTKLFTACAIGTLTAATAFADTADQQRADSCVAEAVDAISVPGGVRYFDPDDGGHKNFAETYTSFMGVSGFLNSYPREDEANNDHVSFYAKYFNEQQGDYMDVYAQTEVTFDENGPIIDPNDFISQNGYRSYITDFNFDPMGDEPSPPEHDIVINAVDTMALVFSVCMNFEPYEKPNGQPISPPVFPDLRF